MWEARDYSQALRSGFLSYGAVPVEGHLDVCQSLHRLQLSSQSPSGGEAPVIAERDMILNCSYSLVPNRSTWKIHSAGSQHPPKSQITSTK